MKQEHPFKMPGGYTASIYNEYDVGAHTKVTTVYMAKVLSPEGFEVDTISNINSLENALKLSGNVALADYKAKLGILSMASKLDRLEAAGWTE